MNFLEEFKVRSSMCFFVKGENLLMYFLQEVKAAYKKKVIAYCSSASSSGKLEECNAAFVEVCRLIDR